MKFSLLSFKHRTTTRVISHSANATGKTIPQLTSTGHVFKGRQCQLVLDHKSTTPPAQVCQSSCQVINKMIRNSHPPHT